MSPSPKQPKKSNTSSPRYYNEYDEFTLWFSMPKSLRLPKTQRAFSKKFGIGEDTVSEWKKRSDFYTKVSEQRSIWARERTSDVFDVLFHRIMTEGSIQAIKLWLESFEGLGSSIQNEDCLKCERRSRFQNMKPRELQDFINNKTDYYKKRKKGKNK